MQQSPLALSVWCLLCLTLLLHRGALPPVSAQTQQVLGWLTNPYPGINLTANAQRANDLHCNPVQTFDSLPADGLQLLSFQMSYWPLTVRSSGPAVVIRVGLYQVSDSGVWQLVASTDPGSDLPLHHASVDYSVPASSGPGPLLFPSGGSSYSLLPGVNYSLCFSNDALNVSGNVPSAYMNLWENEPLDVVQAYSFQPYYIADPLPLQFPAEEAVAPASNNNVWQLWLTAGTPLASTGGAAPSASSSSSAAPVPAFSLQEPSLVLQGVNPYYMISAPQGTASGVTLFAYDPTLRHVFALAASGAVLAQTTVSMTMQYWEARPQLATGLVWALAQDDYAYSDLQPDLLAFDQSTLAIVRHIPYSSLVLTPAGTSATGYGFLATDSSGTLYLSLTNWIYALDPVSGAQLSAFSVPNEEGTVSFSDGYFLAFDPADVLWIVDNNAVNGSFNAWRSSSSGSILNSGQLGLPYSEFNVGGLLLQSFAVDSAGNGWLSVFYLQAVWKVAPDFSLISRYDIPGPAFVNTIYAYDVEMSVSWGATPAQDQVFLYSYGRPPIQIMSPTGQALGVQQTAAVFSPTAFCYDAHDGSFLLGSSTSEYSAVRVSEQGVVMYGFFLGFDSIGFPFLVSGISADGAGYFAMAGTGADGITPQLWLFLGNSPVWQMPAGLGTAVAIDAAAQRVYVPAGDSTLASYDYTGVLQAAVTVAASVSSATSFLFVPAAAGGPAIASCDGSSDTVLLLALPSLSLSTLYNGAGGPQASVRSLALSADGSVLYIAGPSVEQPTGSVWAVDMATNAVLLQLDASVQGAGLVALHGSGAVWVPELSGNDFLIFAPTPAVGGTGAASSTGASSVLGDPQFVGLRGQSYQVHGIDGAVYNIISEQSTQVNARFVFLTQGSCPLIGGFADSNCWSHPGSYLGELSFQQLVDGELHAALVTAGPAKKGFAGVQMDGKVVAIGQTVSFGSFSLTVKSTHSVEVTTEHFAFELSNSDMFVNQAVRATVPLSSLASHGLLGQTHSGKTHPGPLRHVEGNVDDYVIADSDVFGTDFLYNQFQTA